MLKLLFPQISQIKLCYTFLCIAIAISGNVSVYPGQDAMFVCSLVESEIHNVVFEWTRQSGSGNMSMNVVLAEDADEEGSTGASGGGDTVHNSMLTISNVNYTNNGDRYYCNSANCIAANCSQSSLSPLSYLTGRCTVCDLLELYYVIFLYYSTISSDSVHNIISSITTNWWNDNFKLHSSGRAKVGTGMEEKW